VETLQEALLRWLQGQGGEVQVQERKIAFTKVLAERRRFLLRRRTSLHLALEICEGKRELVARLSLRERGAGLPPETGIGRAIEKYRIGESRTGKIEERRAIPFDRYRLSFDYTAFQEALVQLAQAHGYTLRWEILPR